MVKKESHHQNTVIATVSKWIWFLGHTFSGHCHDYTMLKAEFSPEHPWFETIRALLDSGYQGICTDFISEHNEIPCKKPRKRKKNPEPKLSDEQKAENQKLSRIRIFVENAIAGLKRFNILVHDFRNHRDQMDDDVIAICAGLWNFLLA